MTDPQKQWAQSRRELESAVKALGFPAELADLIAKQLKSPKAMDRMSSYLVKVRPRSMEMIVDEMLALSAEIESWKKKKEAQEAQAGYSAWLNSEARWNLAEEE